MTQVRLNKNLVTAYKNNDYDEMVNLLQQGAEITYRSNYILKDAAYECNVDVIDLALMYGADPFVKRGEIFKVTSWSCPDYFITLLDRYKHRLGEIGKSPGLKISGVAQLLTLAAREPSILPQAMPYIEPYLTVNDIDFFKNSKKSELRIIASYLE